MSKEEFNELYSNLTQEQQEQLIKQWLLMLNPHNPQEDEK